MINHIKYVKQALIRGLTAHDAETPSLWAPLRMCPHWPPLNPAWFFCWSDQVSKTFTSGRTLFTVLCTSARQKMEYYIH